jgi:hypothetical protein
VVVVANLLVVGGVVVVEGLVALVDVGIAVDDTVVKGEPGVWYTVDQVGV